MNNNNNNLPQLRETLHRRLLAAPFDPSALERAELRARLGLMLREEAPLLTVPGRRCRARRTRRRRRRSRTARAVACRSDASPRSWSTDRGVSTSSERVACSAVACDIDAAAIARVVERVIAPLGLRLDRSSPMVDARLADGSRLHAVLPPLAPDGPCVTIRRFGARPVPIDAFGLDVRSIAFLHAMVRAGWNVVVAGATSAGKTTLCNALARAIATGERIVTIEETAELRLEQPHVVRLEARPANAEGVGGVGVRELVRAAAPYASRPARRWGSARW